MTMRNNDMVQAITSLTELNNNRFETEFVTDLDVMEGGVFRGGDAHHLRMHNLDTFLCAICTKHRLNEITDYPINFFFFFFRLINFESELSSMFIVACCIIYNKL